jgi:hypothetical protein
MNPTVKYTVEIDQQGTGATQAANELQRVRNEFKATGTAAQTATQQIQTLNTGGVVTLTRNAAALRSGLQLLNVAGFDGATAGALKLKIGMDALRNGAAAMGASLGATTGALAVFLASGAAVLKLANEIKALIAADAPGAQARAVANLNQLRGSLETNLRGLIDNPATMKEALALWERFIQLNQAGLDSTSALRPITTQVAGMKALLDMQPDLDRLNLSEFEAQVDSINRKFDELARKVVETGAPDGMSASALRQIEDARESAIGKLNKGRSDRAQRMSEELAVASSPEGPQRAQIAAGIQRLNREEAIKELRQENIISAEDEARMLQRNTEAWQLQLNSILTAKQEITQFQAMAMRAEEMFSAGFADAFVDFISGAKSAEDAFRQFAQSFLTEVSKMIMQQLVLNAVRSVVGGAAQGGVFPRMMASGGIAGVGMVSSATYFPRFNVVAGEAGAEWFTVLSRPRMMRVGGVEAAVGNAGPNRLALTSADQLERRGGKGGPVEIIVSMDPGLRAEIVSDASQVATVRVANDLSRDSRISRKVRSLS